MFVPLLLFLFQIGEVLKDASKWSLFSAHVDRLLVSCSIQLEMRMALTKQLPAVCSDVVSLYNTLATSLIHVSIQELWGVKCLYCA